MNIGEKIKETRKKENLSQEQFSELFNVTRQTVSNWENEKSYPDLDMIVRISQHFNLSIDDLLDNQVSFSQNITEEKIKKKKTILIITVTVLSLLILGVFAFFYIQEKNHTSFDWSKNTTINTQSNKNETISIDTRYFNLQKDEKFTISVSGDIDSGILIISIIDSQTKKEVYQITGDTLNDTQTMFLEKSSYQIQIKADNYKENIVSFDYQIKIDNR